MKIRLTQIDGKFPNLALMKLSHFHKAKGDEVFFEKSVFKGLFEPEYDTVYGSAIFSTSNKKVEVFKNNFPNAIIGGTGTGDNKTTVEDALGLDRYEKYDYEIYPDFEGSIGFTQRGCRLRCKFCVVPEKEGKNVESKLTWCTDTPPEGKDILIKWQLRQDERINIAVLENGEFVLDRIKTTIPIYRLISWQHLPE